MMLKDRIAVVTGAAGGIGSAVARAFAREGAQLCLCDIADLTAVANDLMTASGTPAFCATFDATHKSEIEAFFENVEHSMGHIDILVNVAGTVSFGSAETLSEAEWDRVIAINLKSTFLTCQTALKSMKTRNYGRIINIGSIVGKNGGNARPWINPAEQQTAANVAYGVSKAGVHAMTLFLAREFARYGVTVNAVAPGPIASAMTTAFPEHLARLIPAGRMGTAADVANACVFLAGDAASFITGEILDVNGGMWSD